MNPEFASEVSLAFGMLLADAMVVFGEAGFIGPSDRIDNHPDGVRLIWPRLLDGRLVAKIPSRDMAFFSDRAAHYPVIIRAARRSRYYMGASPASNWEALRSVQEDQLPFETLSMETVDV